MKRIYADIAGDLLHYGHIEFFKELHNYGDYVIIGIHSDQDIYDYKKKYPILTMEERKKMLEGCKFVDKVIVNAPVHITEKYLADNNIDLVAHGHDESDTFYDEYYAIPIKLNKFIRTEYHRGISTTDIIRRCIDRYSK